MIDLVSESEQMIVGIDPSLTGSAVCLWLRDEPVIHRYTSKPAGTLEGRIIRYGQLVRLVVSNVAPEALVLLEGYSHGSRGAAVTDLAEYGGLLRAALLAVTHNVVEVAPSALKKFATGKGNVNKGAVQAHVAKRWGVIHETDDETDAYVLARMALVYAGAEAETEWQREVIRRLKSPPVKKKRREKV